MSDIQICEKKSKTEEPDNEWINMKGKTLLWYATYHANFEVVEYLVKHKQNIDFSSADESTQLCISIRNKNGNAIAILSSGYLQSNYKEYHDMQGYTKLCETYTNYNDFVGDLFDDAELRSKGLVRLICGPRIDPGSRSIACFNQGNYGTLSNACFHNFTSQMIFGHLLKNIYYNYERYEEKTPLNQALFDNNTRIAKLLLQNGAKPCTEFCREQNLGLYYAIYHLNVELVASLLSFGAKIDESCEDLIEWFKRYYGGITTNVVKIDKLLNYYKDIRVKIAVLALFREFDEDNLLSKDYLPRDMFRIICNQLLNPDDEYLEHKKKTAQVGFLSWVGSFFW